jgi:uncharacterized membrane protein
MHNTRVLLYYGRVRIPVSHNQISWCPPVTIRIRNDLILINTLVILLNIVINIVDTNVLRAILGVPFVIFFPGYTMLAALIPGRNTSLDNLERLVLSFALSPFVVGVFGFALSYTASGFTLQTVLISLTAFIIIMSMVAWIRRRPVEEEPNQSGPLDQVLLHWGGQGRTTKFLYALLAAAVLLVMGALAYVVAVPKIGETFTEFYVLGDEGMAQNYPDELNSGELTRVVVGIVNYEQEQVTYRLDLNVGENKLSEIAGIVLEYEEKWEQEIPFALNNRAGERHKLELVLYKDDEPYRQLYLLIDVIE